MAKSNFFHPFVLLLCLFIAFHVLHARDSQFFSKFTANSDDSNPVGPSNEQSEFLEKQSQDPPSFVAESRNGFGLYGHESGQFPPSLTDEQPYYNKDVFATEDQGNYGNVIANGVNNYYAVGNQYANNDDNNVQQQQQQQQSDTRFVENGKYSYNSYNNNKNNVDDEEKYDPARYSDTRNAEFDDNNVQQQQSDMRFVENGKYSYNSYNNNNNVDGEEKYDPARYSDTRNAEFDNNNNQGEYYGDRYGTAGSAGGYEPVKDLNEFRGRKNVDDEGFMP